MHKNPQLSGPKWVLNPILCRPSRSSLTRIDKDPYISSYPMLDDPYCFYLSSSLISCVWRCQMPFMTKVGNEFWKRSASSVGGPPSQKLSGRKTVSNRSLPSRWLVEQRLTSKHLWHSYIRRHNVGRASLVYSNICEMKTVMLLIWIFCQVTNRHRDQYSRQQYHVLFVQC